MVERRAQPEPGHDAEEGSAGLHLQGLECVCIYMARIQVVRIYTIYIYICMYIYIYTILIYTYYWILVPGPNTCTIDACTCRRGRSRLRLPCEGGPPMGLDCGGKRGDPP